MKYPWLTLVGGETLYGVDTWIYTLGQRNQPLEKLLSHQWFKAFLKKLYAFISYNRRIIITAAPRRWQLLDLQPDFHAGHRLAFILAIFGVTTWLWLAGNSSIWQLLLLIIAQIITTQLYLLTQPSINTVETILDYTGHLTMSLFVGTLLITIGLVIGWSALEPVGYAFMIGQHFIRVYRLGLSPWLSVWFTVLVFLLLL